MPRVCGFLVVLVALLSSANSIAQRHSGDTKQGYFNRPVDSILNIEDAATKKWTYLRLSELKRRRMVEVDVPDVRTGQPVAFEGVLLNDLLPKRDLPHFTIFKDGLFHDRLAFQSGDLDSSAETLIAYDMNGKSLGAHPFWLIARDRRGSRIILSNLAFIRVE